MLGLAATCLMAAANVPVALAAIGSDKRIVASSPVALAALLAPETAPPAPGPRPIQLASHLITGTYSDGTPYSGSTSTSTTSTSTTSTSSTSTSSTSTSSGSTSLPKVSGLPWSSGAGCHTSGFDTWRGRSSDVYTFWAPFGTWDEAVNSIGWYQKYASMSGRLSLGLPVLTKDTKGRFDLCNSGAFDAKVREIGRRLQAYGLGRSIVRLGWEMNHTSNPWTVPGSQKSAYKSCFQRQVNILRSQAPNLLIEWTPNKGGKYGYDIRDIYPGNAHVNIIGVDYYDGWWATNEQSSWDKMYSRTEAGGPHGLGTWLAFAKSQGKPLAVAEWGVCKACSDPAQTDNPFYIRKMNEFFRANAGNIAYETYFNCGTRYNGATHLVYPSSDNPKASAEYNSRW